MATEAKEMEVEEREEKEQNPLDLITELDQEDRDEFDNWFNTVQAGELYENDGLGTGIDDVLFSQQSMVLNNTAIMAVQDQDPQTFKNNLGASPFGLVDQFAGSENLDPNKIDMAIYASLLRSFGETIAGIWNASRNYGVNHILLIAILLPGYTWRKANEIYSQVNQDYRELREIVGTIEDPNERYEKINIGLRLIKTRRFFGRGSLGLSEQENQGDFMN